MHGQKNVTMLSGYLQDTTAGYITYGSRTRCWGMKINLVWPEFYGRKTLL